MMYLSKFLNFLQFSCFDKTRNFQVNELSYVGSLSKVQKRIKPPYDSVKIIYEIFLTVVDEDESLFNVQEGDGLKFFYLEEAKLLKLSPEIDMETLDLVSQYI